MKYMQCYFFGNALGEAKGCHGVEPKGARSPRFNRGFKLK